MINKRKAQWHRCEKTGREFLHALEPGADYFSEGVKSVPIGEPFEVQGPPEVKALWEDGCYLARSDRSKSALCVVAKDGRLFACESYAELDAHSWRAVTEPIKMLPGVTL